MRTVRVMNKGVVRVRQCGEYNHDTGYIYLKVPYKSPADYYELEKLRRTTTSYYLVFILQRNIPRACNMASERI